MQAEQILTFFAKYIEKELGIVYAEHNYFQLENRLLEISKLLGVESLEALYQLAQKGISGSFSQLLMDTATNNETSFFRDLKIFRSIENEVLPKYTKPPLARGPLLIWSAASSSGQEAYSTAITILEWSKKTFQPFDFRIIATDISERILKKAAAGTYSQLEVQRGLPAPLLIKYFKKDENDLWTVDKAVRSRVEFKKLNLKEDFRFQNPFDLVLCRNVLIYQSVEGKKDILKKIFNSLAPEGFLVLGAGESLIGLSDDYKQTLSEGAVIYQKVSNKLKVA